jgi:hypothetical protein
VNECTENKSRNIAVGLMPLSLLQGKEEERAQSWLELIVGILEMH